MATPKALFSELGKFQRGNNKSLLKLLSIESGGNAVKGLSFHHKRPWILAGFVSGMIEIWDYYSGNMIDQFEGGHNGEVRTVNFHVSCPLFVSGGYDGKIKLWDYDETSGLRSTSSLEGHNGSVNDVQFHHDLPWLVSASDDCTVRLWNWSSRDSIAVFTEHTGAVTSSSFHPKHDLVLSSSLDRKLCVWDIGGLRPSSLPNVDCSQTCRRWHWLAAFCGKSSKKYGARLKYVLDGHMSGVVRAIFHPTLPFIFSASNDCSVYWWTVQDSLKPRNNYQALFFLTEKISCLAYSPKMNIVMSTPDGKNLFVCDPGSTAPRKDFGRLTIDKKNISHISSHPTKNLFAVGHTDGITVYRQDRNPPAFSVVNSVLYYVKDKKLKTYDYSFNKGHDVLGPMEELPNPTFWSIATALSCSPQGDAALICVDNKTYRLVHLNASNRINNKENAATPTAAEEGKGLSAVFIAPDRFVVLVRVGTTAVKKNILSLRNLTNQIVSESPIHCDVDGLSYYAGLGNCLLCRGPDKVVMFDLGQSTAVAELGISSVRDVFWAGGNKEALVVALVGNHFITMADEKLMQLCTVKEHNSIESGAWDEENNGIFIYKTWKDIKYCLVNGESGIIMPFNQPLYITKVSGSTIYSLDEDGEVSAITVDAAEYIMKSSIMNKDYVKQCSLCSC